MTSTTSAAVTPHVILALCGLALFSGCGALYRAQPLQLSPDAVMSPYVQDVYSDEPLAHWRLEAGQVGAIAGDASEAMALPESHSVELSGADFGGSELALELWVCAAQGTALTYTDSGGVDRLVLKVGQQIDLDLLGEEVAVGAMPSGRCHHLGISWRGQDGALVVVVDGKIQWMGAAARGSLPFGGRLLIGGRFRGIVDEVAVFDRFIYPGTWLRRHQVALGNSRPAVLSQRQPVRPILQTGHVGGIYSIAWSHDGRQVATGGWDQSIKVWEAQGGALLSNMRGHEGIVTGLDWSPDGTRLASSSRDNSIKVWDGVTGALVHDLRERIRGPGVVAVVWSPRGGRLASAGRDRTVKVWDAKEGKLIHELNHNATLESVVWSPNERWLASASTDGSVSVWDATNGQLVRAFEFHSDGAVEVSWSPDGSQLASASRDGTVKVVDVGSLHLAVEIKAHQAEVHALAWSPDGARIASASRDHSVKVWDPRSGTLINEHNAHTKAVRDVQFSEDGRWLASASWDGTAKVWDSRKGTVVHDFAEVRGRGVEFVSWSPDGKRLAFAGEKLNLVETVGFKRIEKSLVQTKGLVEARWHPEGSVVAALTREGKVQVWDASTAVMKHNLETRNGAGLDLAWSPDGETLASVGSGGALLAWSKDGKVIFDVKGHGRVLAAWLSARTAQSW